MANLRIYADFQNLDDDNRLRLTCVGTTRDLARHGIALREGLALAFYTDDADDQGQRDDLLIEGVVTYSPQEQCWVAAVDWKAIRNASDEPKQETNRTATSSAGTSPVIGPPVSGEQP